MIMAISEYCHPSISMCAARLIPRCPKQQARGLADLRAFAVAVELKAAIRDDLLSIAAAPRNTAEVLKLSGPTVVLEIALSMDVLVFLSVIC